MALRIRLARLLARRTDEEAAKAVIAVAMALVTLFATGVAYLQQDASIESGVAQRTAEQVSTDAMGAQIASLARSTADYGGYRRWYEALMASSWAYNLNAQADPSHYDDGLLSAMSRAESSLATWTAAHTDLLQPPYFDAALNNADFGAYWADTQVGPAFRSMLEADAALDLAAEWGNRSSGYVTVLTLLAVALFFFGLATTLGARTRGLFAITGGGVVAAALVWTAVLATDVPRAVPAALVDAIVDARTEAAHVMDGAVGDPVSDADRAHFESALASVDAAVAADPSNAQARLARAEVSEQYANALYFRASDPELVADLLDTSVADFGAYLAGDGADDYSAWWNLGWAHMLRGEAAEGIAATDRAIEQAPTYFVLYLNRALGHLLAGDAAAARADTAQAVRVAASSNLDSNALFLARSEFDIERLAAKWTAHRDDLLAMVRTLREADVSLKALGKPGPVGDPPEIEATFLVRISLQPDGTFAPAFYEPRYEFASGDTFGRTEADGIRVFVQGEEIAPGTTVSFRVWRNGVLDAGSAADRPWEPLDRSIRYMTFDILSPYGQAGLDLEPGAYHLEIYLDGHTRGEADWTVTG